jgi:hypothetical protein
VRLSRKEEALDKNAEAEKERGKKIEREKERQIKNRGHRFRYPSLFSGRFAQKLPSTFGRWFLLTALGKG